MADQHREGTTKRDPNDDVVKEGGLPKDQKTAEAGDNRRNGDLDGNRTAPPAKKDA
jgi:hypothetical protein